jgi:hypothetical protein
MKKLYFLNEEEKQRILKLHKSHQVGKFWLNEQHNDELDEQSVGSGTVSTLGSAAAGAGVGAGVGALFGVAGAVPGAIIGGIGGALWGLVTSINSGMDRSTWGSKVSDACSKSGSGTATLSEEQITAIAEKMNNLILTQNDWGGGYATEASRMGMKETLTNIPSLPDFCAINTKYGNVYGISLIDDLIREIYRDDYFGQVVKLPVQKAIDKSIDITKKTEKEGGKTTGETGGDFFVDFACLEGIATATKGKGVYRVDNPSSHRRIIDKSQGKQTNISEKTLFLSDGTYATDTDVMRETISGTWKCDPSQEKVLLYPGTMGIGKEGGIYSKFPCLTTESPSGGPYTSLDPGDNNVAIMDDEVRMEHPIFKTYPIGDLEEMDITFNIDGTFLTDYDFENDLEKSGRFVCKGKKIKAKPYGGLKKSSTTPTPIPDTGGGGGAPVSGMGIVLGSVQGEIAEVLKCAKVGGTTLTQDALNKLYDFIKNNK